MVSETWYSEIESTIYTILQHNLVYKDDAPFPYLNCTTSSQSESLDGVSDFPTLYIHMLAPSEQGNDLFNQDVVAIRATFDFQVFSDDSEEECRKIMNACILEMKKLRFKVAMFPDPQTIDKKYYALARFSRIVASGDTEIVPQEMV